MKFDEELKRRFLNRAAYLRSERDRYANEGRVIMVQLCDISISVYESV